MKTKKFSPLLVFAALLWLTALCVATVYDLQISLSIANENSLYGKIFEVIGEVPAILFASFNLALMGAYYVKKSEKRSFHVLLIALCHIGTVGTAYFACHGVFGYFDDYGILNENGIFTVLATAAVYVILIVLSMKLKEETLERCFKTACRCVLAAALTLVIIWAFKLTFGRVRFRQLDGELSRFTPWYKPNGFRKDFYSFPSGHTANATVILTITYYIKLLPEKIQKHKKTIYALPALWIAVVAFSRVAIGAHYLSDVLFGMAITLVIVYFTKPRS